MQEKGKYRYYTLRNSFGCSAGVVLLFLSVFFRLVAYWGRWQGMGQMELILELALPVSAALLMILCLLLFGRIALWTTALPMLMGAAFFIVKAFSLESTVQTVLYVLLYVFIAVLWCGTVFNLWRGRWLLPPLFLLPFAYRVGVEDLKALQRVDPPVAFADGMREMSILCVMLALFFISLAIRKRYKTPPQSGETGAEPAAAVPVPGQETQITPESEAEIEPEAELEPEPESEPEPEPEPKPEPEPEQAAVAEKGGLLGKLFHRGEKQAAAAPAAAEAGPEAKIEAEPEPEEPAVEPEPSAGEGAFAAGEEPETTGAQEAGELSAAEEASSAESGDTPEPEEEKAAPAEEPETEEAAEARE